MTYPTLVRFLPWTTQAALAPRHPPHPTANTMVRVFATLRMSDQAFASEFIRSGKVGPVLEEFMKTFKPEMGYGFVDQGVRTLVFVFNFVDDFDVVKLSEAAFQAFHATWNSNHALAFPSFQLMDLKSILLPKTGLPSKHAL